MSYYNYIMYIAFIYGILKEIPTNLNRMICSQYNTSKLHCIANLAHLRIELIVLIGICNYVLDGTEKKYSVEHHFNVCYL